MIDKPIETVMRESNRDILIPADLVATVNQDNNLQHVFMVLTKVKYAKIPVLDNDNHFKGIITRRELFKEINYLAHNFNKRYIALPVYNHKSKSETKNAKVHGSKGMIN